MSILHFTESPLSTHHFHLTLNIIQTEITKVIDRSAPLLFNAFMPTSKKAWAFIIIFLALQIGLPLSYYLSEGIYDERFSWRMFSPVRLSQCHIQFFEDKSRQKQIKLSSELHFAWINLMKRARLSVIETYAQQKCESQRQYKISPELYINLFCEDPIKRTEKNCQKKGAPSSCYRQIISPWTNQCEVSS